MQRLQPRALDHECPGYELDLRPSVLAAAVQSDEENAPADEAYDP
jgi:hypothetical protein